jgi:3-deoxy-D-manno-octulosonic-acid transferase
VGEVNLLAPLLARWDRLHPEWEVVISTTTQAGYKLACKRYAPRRVIYCPLDFTWAVRRAMRAIRPTLLVLTELELWPNLIAAAKAHGARVAVINGRLSAQSFRGYRRVGWLLRRTLAALDLVAAQNDEYAARFAELGVRPEALHVTGSIKFDGARTSRQAPEVRRLAELVGLSGDEVVFLAGSTQESEEALAVDVFERLAGEFPQLRLIVVPRHPERFDDVAALLARRGVAYVRRSRLEGAPRAVAGQGEDGPLAERVQNCPLAERADHIGRADQNPRVLLVDAVGELGAWWGTASIAFVGGSLTRRGGQNMIEPAGYGAAVSFGPNTWNFRDVVSLLLAHEAAVVVRDGSELEAFVRRCLSDPPYAAELGRRAQQLVVENQGAADRTVVLLEGLLPEVARAHRAA